MESHGPRSARVPGLEEARDVRIVLLTGLGDVVHGLPIANAIRREHPDCRITWVVEPMPAGLLAPHPAIDRVVVFRRRDGLRGLAELRRSLAAGARPDLTLNLNVYFKSVFPTILSPAKRRLGFDASRSRDGVWLFSNHRLERRPRAHTQDMFLEFLDALGVPAGPLEWRLAPTPAEAAEQRAFFSALGGEPAAAIVTASANRLKDWPPERYIELADRLHSELRLRPVLIGGPGARENGIAQKIAARAAAPVVNALGHGVRRLLWLIEKSRLVIAPDTGPVHIARALGVPVVGLYGHTNPWRVGPYRRFEDLWVDRYNEPGASPDPSLFEPKHGRMERIHVDDVLEKAELALLRYPAPGEHQGAAGRPRLRALRGSRPARARDGEAGRGARHDPGEGVS